MPRLTFGEDVGERAHVENRDPDTVGDEPFDHTGSDTCGASRDDGNLALPVPSALVGGETPSVHGPAIQHLVDLDYSPYGQRPLEAPMQGAEKPGLTAKAQRFGVGNSDQDRSESE